MPRFSLYRTKSGNLAQAVANSELAMAVDSALENFDTLYQAVGSALQAEIKSGAQQYTAVLKTLSAQQESAIDRSSSATDHLANINAAMLIVASKLPAAHKDKMPPQVKAIINNVKQCRGLSNSLDTMINNLQAVIQNAERVLKEIEKHNKDNPAFKDPGKVHNVKAYIANCKKALEDAQNMQKQAARLNFANPDSAEKISGMVAKSVAQARDIVSPAINGIQTMHADFQDKLPKVDSTKRFENR